MYTGPTFAEVNVSKGRAVGIAGIRVMGLQLDTGFGKHRSDYWKRQ
jgi:hypothetical protein